MKKYRIPRNIKTGMSFMGLELKAWLMFLPIVIIFVAFFFFLVPKPEIKILGIVFSVALTHLMFQTDEKTGVLNISLFVERIKWIYLGDKIIYPTWSEDSERTSGINITVQEQKRRRDS